MESIAFVKILNRAFQPVFVDQVLPDIVPDLLNVIDMVFIPGDGIHLYLDRPPAIAWTYNIKKNFLAHRPEPLETSSRLSCFASL